MTVPASLINSLTGIKGFDKEAFEKVHQSGEQVTSIRLNPKKISAFSNAFLVNERMRSATAVPWSSRGFYLSHRPSFTLDPLFHAGAYYVQEASSMFLEEALRQTADLARPLKVLDLCAAPGGKSTLIQSIISAESLLVSNEIIKTRVTILAENITKWGACNVIVTNNDPKDFQRLPGYFDVIVTDAPCSGSGLFRKDPKAIEEWSIQNVQLCSHRQQRILADVLPSLKQGGILIYSTCSFSKEEDEDMADWLTGECRMKSLSLDIKVNHEIIETASPLHNAYGYRFYPDKVKGEGFFLAAFVKEEQVISTVQSNKERSRSGRLSSKETEAVKAYLQKPGDFFYIIQNKGVIAIPPHLDKELAIIQSALYIKKAGVKLGSIIRQELIPDHELAVSTDINPAISFVEADRETALQYLRRKDIELPAGANKGWSLLTYEKLPIGWIKVLTNRINNYYPKDWRILHK